MGRVEDGWHYIMGQTVYVKNNKVLYGMTRYGEPIRPYNEEKNSMKRAISFALVVLVIAAGFAGCIGSSKLSPADVTEASAEWSSEGVTEETLLSVIMTAVTTKANPTKAPTKKATTAAPREEDSSAPQATAPQPTKTGAAFFAAQRCPRLMTP